LQGMLLIAEAFERRHIMLVMSRRIDQSAVIGDAIEVKVVQILSDKVEIGIIAPATIPIHRREVIDSFVSPGSPPDSQPLEQFVGPDLEPCGEMLLLMRKINESIVINGDIIILLVRIRKDNVCLAFEAPKEVCLARREVYDMIKQDQEKK